MPGSFEVFCSLHKIKAYFQEVVNWKAGYTKEPIPIWLTIMYEDMSFIEDEEEGITTIYSDPKICSNSETRKKGFGREVGGDLWQASQWLKKTDSPEQMWKL